MYEWFWFDILESYMIIAFNLVVPKLG